MNKAKKLIQIVEDAYQFEQDEIEAHFVQDVTSQLPKYSFQWKNLEGEIKYARTEDDLQKLIKKDRDEIEGRRKGKKKKEIFRGVQLQLGTSKFN